MMRPSASLSILTGTGALTYVRRRRQGDASFGNPLETEGADYDVDLLPDGRIVTTGRCNDADGDYDFAAVRYHRDGSLDTSFDTDGKLIIEIGGVLVDDIAAGAIAAGGRLIIAGTSNGNFALVRVGERSSPSRRHWNVTSVTDGVEGGAGRQYLYDPYGAVTHQTAAWGNRTSSSYSWNYLHQGGRHDSSSNLYHFRNRDYSASLGRWVQTDPLKYHDGANLYQGLASNPLSLLDPEGELGIRITATPGPAAGDLDRLGGRSATADEMGSFSGRGRCGWKSGWLDEPSRPLLL